VLQPGVFFPGVDIHNDPSAGPIAVDTSFLQNQGFGPGFDGVSWQNSINTEVAATGVGNATINGATGIPSSPNSFQDISLTVNEFVLNNATLAAPTNTASVSGSLFQIVGEPPASTIIAPVPNVLQLTNDAVAFTVIGTASISNETQAASFNANSFGAGVVDNLFLVQVGIGSGEVLLGNQQNATGSTAATISNAVQFASYSLNTAAIGSTGLNTSIDQFQLGTNVSDVNTAAVSASFLNGTASITNATQVVSVNLNTAAIGPTLPVSSSVAQVALGTSVSSLNSLSAVGANASITGAIQSISHTINAITK